MDQIKTGRFIAAERKRQGRTQRQLAEALGISDKTVSKWECGNGFPEVSLLLPLCQALEVSVNELLTGARVSDQEYRGKAEDNMVDLVRQAQENRKKLLLSVAVAALTSTAITMVKAPCKMVWEISRILTLYWARRLQTAAIIPTRSWPTTETMACMAVPPCAAPPAAVFMKSGKRQLFSQRFLRRPEGKNSRFGVILTHFCPKV